MNNSLDIIKCFSDWYFSIDIRTQSQSMCLCVSKFTIICYPTWICVWVCVHLKSSFHLNFEWCAVVFGDFDGFPMFIDRCPANVWLRLKSSGGFSELYKSLSGFMWHYYRHWRRKPAIQSTETPELSHTNANRTQKYPNIFCDKRSNSRKERTKLRVANDNGKEQTNKTIETQTCFIFLSVGAARGLLWQKLHAISLQCMLTLSFLFHLEWRAFVYTSSISLSKYI